MASKAAGLGSARGILNPGYDYYHQPGKSLVPRYVLHYTTTALNYDLLAKRIMISKGLVSKDQYSKFGPVKGFQYSF